MLSTLLQVTQQSINGMTEVVFGVKDIFTIGGSIIATVTAYLTLKFELKAFKESTLKKLDDIDRVHDKFLAFTKEELINAKRDRNSIKRELLDDIKEKNDTSMKRIDKTQLEMKEYVNTTNAEFKEINSKLDRILGKMEEKLIV